MGLTKVDHHAGIVQLSPGEAGANAPIMTVRGLERTIPQPHPVNSRKPVTAYISCVPVSFLTTGEAGVASRWFYSSEVDGVWYPVGDYWKELVRWVS